MVSPLYRFKLALSRGLFVLFISFLLSAQGHAQAPDALTWTNATPNGLNFTPTLYVVGDPKLPAAALRGLSRIIHPQGGSSGGDSLLIPAVKAGLLIALFFACAAWFSKGQMGLVSWLSVCFVAWLMFIQTSTVRVQTYFTYSGSTLSTGQLDSSGLVANGSAGTSNGIFAAGGAGRFELVEGVPLGFALPVGISGAISTAMADLFMTSYSSVNSSDTGGLQFADPLKVLLELRATNPCVSAQLCKSIFEYTRYCLVGTVIDSNGQAVPAGVDVQALARSPTALDDMLMPSGGWAAQGWVAGLTNYYPPPALGVGSTLSAGKPMACSEAGPKIREDIAAFTNGTTVRSQMGTATAVPGTKESSVAAPLSSATANPAIGALENLQQIAGLTSLNASAAIQNLVAWKAISAGIQTVSTPMDSASFTAMTMVQEATEKWRIDGAAEGSVFLRGLFATFNVMLFVLICFTPMVFILAVTMFGETMKILKEYIIAIVWTQSWFPAAVIVNFYITETLSTKIFSYNNINPSAIFAPINHVAFYEELASSIGSAGWMIGSIPVLTYALLRGSVQGIVSLASKAGGGGGAKYADESTAAPSLASATNSAAMAKAATDIGHNVPYASGQGAAGNSWDAPGSGMSVGMAQATGTTATAAVSAQNRATESSSLATDKMAAAATAITQAVSRGSGITLTHGDGSTTSILGDAFSSDSNGVSKTLTGALRSIAAAGLHAGLDAGAVGAALVAGGAAYKAATAGGATGAAATKAANGAMVGKLGGKYAGAAAVAFAGAAALGVAKALGKGSGVNAGWTESSSNELANALTNTQQWASKIGASNQKGFQSGVNGVEGATASDTDALSKTFTESQRATATAQRDSTNAATATQTASNASNVGGNASVSQGDVTNAARTGGMLKSAVDNAVAVNSNKLVSSGAISPQEAAEAHADYGTRSQAALRRQPAAMQGTPGGQVAAAIAAVAGMASNGATVGSRLVGGASFGTAATLSGGKSSLTESGSALTEAYLGSGTAGTGATAVQGGSTAVSAVGTNAMPNQPEPVAQSAGAATLGASVATVMASTSGTIAQRQTKIDTAIAAVVASGAATQAQADAIIRETRLNGEGSVNGSPLQDKSPKGPPGGQELKSVGVPLKGKPEGQGAPDQTPPSDFSPASFPSIAPSEADQAKARRNGLSPANEATVKAITGKRSDVALPVAEAIARSSSSVPDANLVTRILQSPKNLAALTSANIPGIGDVSKLPEQTQGELAVFMDRMGANAIPLLQGKLSPDAARAELSKLVGDGEMRDKLTARFNNNPQAALLAYSAASAVALAAGKSPPAIEGRTPTGVENEVIGFMDRTLSPMTVVGGVGLGVLINEIGYFGGAALNKVTTGNSGLGAAPVAPDLSTFPKITQPGWVAGVPQAPTPAGPTNPPPTATAAAKPTSVRPVTPLPAAAERVLTTLAQNPTAAKRIMSPDGVRRLLASESGGQPTIKNAQGSSATGLGQFVDRTWLGEATRANSAVNRVALEKGFLEQTPKGLRIAAGKQADLLALRNDPALMTEATIAYAQQNLAILSAAKIDGIGDVSKLEPQKRDGYAYVMHLLGPGNGIRILTGGASALSEAESRTLLEQQIGVVKATRYAELAGGAAPALQRFVTQRARKVGGINPAG